MLHNNTTKKLIISSVNVNRNDRPTTRLPPTLHRNFCNITIIQRHMLRFRAVYRHLHVLQSRLFSAQNKIFCSVRYQWRNTTSDALPAANSNHKISIFRLNLAKQLTETMTSGDDQIFTKLHRNHQHRPKISCSIINSDAILYTREAVTCIAKGIYTLHLRKQYYTLHLKGFDYVTRTH